MARYRPVLCAFWHDPDIESLSPNHKLLFLFLCTNPLATESGMYKISIKRMSEGTGITVKAINKILPALPNIYYDHDNQVVFVVNMFKYNRRGRPELIEQAIINDVLSCSTDLWGVFKDKYSLYISGSPNIRQVLDKYSPNICKILYRTESRNRTEKENSKEGKFCKPTLEEVTVFCRERKNNVDPVKFWHFYESKNWMVGKSKMKSWKSAIISTWEKNAQAGRATKSDWKGASELKQK